MANSYHTALNKDYTLKIRTLLTELPVLGSVTRVSTAEEERQRHAEDGAN